MSPVDRTAAWMVEAVHVALATGVTLVLLIPAARGTHATLGWLPLWLVGMPLAACVAWHAVVHRRAAAPAPARVPALRRRVARTQAVRRGARVPGSAWRHAA